MEGREGRGRTGMEGREGRGRMGMEGREGRGRTGMEGREGREGKERDGGGGEMARRHCIYPRFHYSFWGGALARPAPIIPE